MARPGEYNTKIDIRNDYVFFWRFKENDGTPINVSTWSFNFILTDPNGNVIWNIINSDFSRPAVNEITFTKTISDMVGMLGLYTIQFLVTKAATNNDTYVYGIYEFVNI